MFFYIYFAYLDKLVSFTRLFAHVRFFLSGGGGLGSLSFLLDFGKYIFFVEAFKNPKILAPPATFL